MKKLILNWLFKKEFFKVPNEQDYIQKSLYLKYDDGKFLVVDEKGDKLPTQVDIEIYQDLDQWQNGYCYAKVGIYLSPYTSKMEVKGRELILAHSRDMANMAINSPNI